MMILACLWPVTPADSSGARAAEFQFLPRMLWKRIGEWVCPDKRRALNTLADAIAHARESVQCSLLIDPATAVKPELIQQEGLEVYVGSVSHSMGTRRSTLADRLARIAE
jgi:hypothetical protein